MRKGDIALLRNVVSALADPAREVATRALLRDRFGVAGVKGLKALLASAPADIEVERSPDRGRNVKL